MIHTSLIDEMAMTLILSRCPLDADCVVIIRALNAAGFVDGEILADWHSAVERANQLYHMRGIAA